MSFHDLQYGIVPSPITVTVHKHWIVIAMTILNLCYEIATLQCKL